MDFQLFKIQIFPSRQGDLFNRSYTKRQILENTILSSPECELRKGYMWHIGNLKKIDENSYYFRLGRTTKSTLEIYKNGNFVDTTFETAPYTHIFLDLELELIALARRPKLSPYITGIVNSLTKLLNASSCAKEFKATFSINYLKDPEDFLTHLHAAHMITKFWVSYKRPNAFDIEKDFIKPSQKLVEETNSDYGKTQIEGENLIADVLEKLSRSAAATGDDAEAWLVLEGEKNKVRKRLRKNPVIVHAEEIDDEENKTSFIEKIRAIYYQIRGNGQVEDAE